jgi:hypothetical protein
MWLSVFYEQKFELTASQTWEEMENNWFFCMFYIRMDRYIYFYRKYASKLYNFYL